MDQVPLHCEYGITAATVEEYKDIQADLMSWNPADWKWKSTCMIVIRQANCLCIFLPGGMHQCEKYYILGKLDLLLHC